MSISDQSANFSNLGNSQAARVSPKYQVADLDPKLSVALNNFAVESYTQLDTELSDRAAESNRIFSPIGLAFTLSMLRNAAQGKTAEQLDEVLHTDAMTPEAWNQAQTVAQDLLRHSDSSVKLEIAHSLWSGSSTQLNTDYVQNMQKHYDAQIEALDLSVEKSVKIINQWASDHTNEKIPKVLQDPPGAEVVLLLMNAMYFNGQWSTPFEAELTQDSAFRTKDGQSIQVPMMKQAGTYEYGEEQGFQVVRLPYGESEKFGMTLILPDKDTSLKQFNQQHLINFEQWSQPLTERRGSIELPRFQIANRFTLNDMLIALGMPDTFSGEKAKFGGLLESSAQSGRVFVSLVKQDTFIEVNEQGTEAAAVTTVFVAGGAPPKDSPFEMKFNRPFFFAITDRTTGLIVFMGEVGNPLES
ncbi:serpin family protein [Saccharibacillus sp. JS10]|uniref:serpin family protein n=1 Tax=Saccharibacillus sp. JS10 TaxID=2950552 RepID=UPI00210CB696|nr:serpin family protein [Saccharibacillus sp. JS10]MCQ4085929.1 serpin family protein [Saccharibacillus sp. JS10]